MDEVAFAAAEAEDGVVSLAAAVDGEVVPLEIGQTATLTAAHVRMASSPSQNNMGPVNADLR